MFKAHGDVWCVLAWRHGMQQVSESLRFVFIKIITGYVMFFQDVFSNNVICLWWNQSWAPCSHDIYSDLHFYTWKVLHSFLIKNHGVRKMALPCFTAHPRHSFFRELITSSGECFQRTLLACLCQNWKQLLHRGTTYIEASSGFISEQKSSINLKPITLTFNSMKRNM